MSRKVRVCEHSPAKHHCLHLGKPCCKCLIVFLRKNIPVIADPVPAQGQGICKNIQIRFVFIIICLQSRVNDQLLHGIFVVNLYQLVKLFCILHTDSRLNGKLQIQCIKNLIKKFFQQLLLSQESRASHFRHNGPGRASQIQIDLLVSHTLQFQSCLHKILCVV